MSLVERIVGWRDSKQVKHHVDRLVDRCAAAVRAAATPVALGMPKAEARGYVRAKAVAVVGIALENNWVLTIPALSKRSTDLVMTLTVERVVVAVTEQIAREKPSLTRQRRAA